MKYITEMRLNRKIHKLFNALYYVFSEEELYSAAARYGRVYALLPTLEMKERFLDELLQVAKNGS
mgnify:FL=1